jgi:hypothetical protein
MERIWHRAIISKIRQPNHKGDQKVREQQIQNRILKKQKREEHGNKII